MDKDIERGHMGGFSRRGDPSHNHTQMVRVLSWNVRGINSPQKQDEVRKFILKLEVGLVGVLEHKVKLAC